MRSTTYYLLENAHRDIIVHGQSGLRVNVFNLETEGFEPKRGEIHIFGDDHGEWLAFETDGWTVKDIDLISGAVLWYARLLDYPEMEVRTMDPRPAHRLRIVIH
ncbi:hypothetical protein GCM10023149_29000 [Mucilaginibacter gynuensis]|uniref:Uncharacterized protein n=1 Tax=Mucilaginibacter gynuensis TaxID=1302236 RepID=A0ABP8GKZ1_9SPHI